MKMNAKSIGLFILLFAVGGIIYWQELMHWAGQVKQ